METELVVAEGKEEIRYFSALSAMMFKQNIENACKQNGYAVGIDFATTKPIYWFPEMPESEHLDKEVVKKHWNIVNCIS